MRTAVIEVLLATAFHSSGSTSPDGPCSVTSARRLAAVAVRLTSITAGAAAAAPVDQAGGRVDDRAGADDQEALARPAPPARPAARCPRGSISSNQTTSGRSSSPQLGAARQVGQRFGAAVLDVAAAGAAHAAQGCRGSPGRCGCRRRWCRPSTFCVTSVNAPGPQAILQSDEGVVAGVGLDRGQVGAAEVVEAPDQGRVAVKGPRRGDLLDAVAFPQPAGAAKRRQAALGRDAGAGQHGDLLGSASESARHGRGVRLVRSAFRNQVHGSAGDPAIEGHLTIMNHKSMIQNMRHLNGCQGHLSAA